MFVRCTYRDLHQLMNIDRLNLFNSFHFLFFPLRSYSVSCVHIPKFPPAKHCYRSLFHRIALDFVAFFSFFLSSTSRQFFISFSYFIIACTLFFYYCVVLCIIFVFFFSSLYILLINYD